jgi:dipeptidyl aminopeptidase/acylaminoacyl peptidase
MPGPHRRIQEDAMPTPQIAPYGAWQSPITSDLIAQATIRLGQIVLDGEDIYWSESRPAEGGRNVIVRRTPNGQTVDVTPPPFDARSRVHEYGGGAFLVSGGTVYFSHLADQRLYRIRPGATPEPLTPPANLRYADLVLDAQRGRLVCVREDHTASDREATNTLVSINLESGGAGHVLASGNDFYSSPRLSPDGARLAWLTWNHPNMPWDGCELWVADLRPGGALARAECVAGGPAESIFQPEWSPDGALYFVSDRSGWWNLYRWRGGTVEPMHEMAAEFGQPQWTFGMSTYGLAGAERIICTYRQGGLTNLAALDTATGRLEPIALPYTVIDGIRVGAGHAVFRASSPSQLPAIVDLELSTGQLQVLRRSSELEFDPGDLSQPQAIEFPTGHGRTAHALFYPPRNRHAAAPPRRATAAARVQPRWTHGRRRDGPGPQHPVLDQPRHRRAPCELWRLDRLRSRLPRTAQGPVGHRRRR